MWCRRSFRSYSRFSALTKTDPHQVLQKALSIWKISKIKCLPSISGNRKVTLMLNTRNFTNLLLTAALLVSQQHLTHGKIHKSTRETRNEEEQKAFSSRMFNNKLLFFVCATDSFELSTSLVKENTQLSQHP